MGIVLRALAALYLSLAAATQDPGRRSTEPDDPHAIARAIATILMPEVSSRLGSDRIEAVAWGAHLAGEHRLTAAVPGLRAALQALAAVDPRQREFAALAVLDALVRTEAVVPADELRPFLTGLHRVPALVLLGRDVDANADFFHDLFRSHDGGGPRTEWLAAGNLLAYAKADGFARTLLDAFAWRIEVLVRDPGASPLRRRGGSAALGANADGRIRVPAGHPPTALYELTEDGRPGDRLFAPGRVSIHVRRTARVETEFGIWNRDRRRPRERPGLRLDWLATLLGTSAEHLRVEFEPHETVDWTDADAFLAAVERARSGVEAQFARLVAGCVAERRLSAAEAAGLRPSISIVVDDRRAAGSAPLPELPAGPRR
jgi:hypothetical protein